MDPRLRIVEFQSNLANPIGQEYSKHFQPGVESLGVDQKSHRLWGENVSLILIAHVKKR